MKKIKINSVGKVKCPTKNCMIEANRCKSCESCFGFVSFSHINCKQGLKKDEHIKGNRINSK